MKGLPYVAIGYFLSKNYDTLIGKIKSEIISNSINAIEEENNQIEEQAAFIEETRFETKPSLWQRIKNSKFVRTIKYIMQIKVVLDYPALPEGRGE